MSEGKLKIQCKVQFRETTRPRKPNSPAAAAAGRIPKISRLMALAIRFEDLLQRGEVRDYAELARLGHVTRARVTQIMNLLNLAPDIQEALLFLPETSGGRDALKEHALRPIARVDSWRRQRRAWSSLAQALTSRAS